MSTGAEMIAAERRRQVEQEGWTPARDAKHHDGGLLKAAVAYLDVNALMAVRNESFVLRKQLADSTVFADPWPWGYQWDKRDKHPNLKRLAIAGALIAAEIDRLLTE